MAIVQTTRRTALGAGLLAPLIPGLAIAKPFPRKLVAPTAPFDMPSIGVPDFSRARRFVITDFGADQGDQAKTSAAIAAAITAANAAGAGVVVVPEGTWPTGKVHFKSNVALHLAKGATLLFSEKPADYLPPVQTTWEGLECWNYSPLVYAFDCENVAITGPGRLKAKLDVWREWYKRPKPHMDALVVLYHQAARGEPVDQRRMTGGEANLRPQFIQFNRCRHVLVEDVSIEDSPFWVIHPFLCADVVIRRVKIRAHGHNNDGVDPEMSQNVLIEDCVFDQGDDAVSVKSGRDQDAWRLGVPTRNVVMRDCQIRNGHQLMAVGSELSAGIENVFVDNCHFTGDGPRGNGGVDGWAVPIANLLFVKTNERRGGFVRGIHMRNVSATKIAGSVLAVDTDVLYQWRTLVPTYERRLTAIEGLRVSDVRVAQAGSICSIKGEKDLPVRDVRLRRVTAGKVAGPVTTENVAGFSTD
ncbi:glycoside hydrolase family 28 protein [Caulobacter sp. CCNWLY153]|uniref:glycoside hydrolase family 28 protein n=1 Tax=unclassified Caulobacter TaxID=2648921 RepID=UPI002FF16892